MKNLSAKVVASLEAVIEKWIDEEFEDLEVSPTPCYPDALAGTMATAALCVMDAVVGVEANGIATDRFKE